MKRRAFSIVLAIAAIALSSVAHSQETMTVERFREIASSPGDNVPLNPKLLEIAGKFTNATITVDLKYADGRKFKEKIAGWRKTVKGNYVVTTVNSELYKQPMSSISAYDEEAGCYKCWSLYGNTLTEELEVYDVEKKLYSTYSIYGDGFLELGVGRYSDTNDCSHTVILKKGVLFGTRDANAVAAKPAAK